jgi:hypothetical protein
MLRLAVHKEWIREVRIPAGLKWGYVIEVEDSDNKHL